MSDEDFQAWVENYEFTGDSKVLAQAWSQLVLNNYGKGVKTLELNIDILFLMETQRHTMRYLTFMESARNEIHITKWTNL